MSGNTSHPEKLTVLRDEFKYNHSVFSRTVQMHAVFSGFGALSLLLPEPGGFGRWFSFLFCHLFFLDLVSRNVRPSRQIQSLGTEKLGIVVLLLVEFVLSIPFFKVRIGTWRVW